jgi:HSP20 family molecular chaperone IbpA
MADHAKDREDTSLEKREATLPEGVERTREGREFIPRSDIYETNDSIVVMADMPGVPASGVDISLEKNVLTIRGSVREASIEGLSLAYREYTDGDFVRTFSISNEVDQDGIEARMSHGVLTLTLPKTGPTTRKIEVAPG